ncbi:MAG: RsmE family RNA methyltransferase [Chlamydiales bacterium]|nr:RsmE family RNA methyltransferase [Chlamydiales bacterium]
MPHERFFIDKPLCPQEIVLLEGDEFNHLSRVMRIQIDESVELVNGRNQLATATLLEISRHSAKLQIHHLTEDKKKKQQIILAQAIPRLNRLEYILEKGTELGASEFWLFPGIRNEKETFSQNQRLRLEHMRINAMKQCGRLDLPRSPASAPCPPGPSSPATRPTP